jgi:KDO2-lipid IV(A) lauroyltransferase
MTRTPAKNRLEYAVTRLAEWGMNLLGWRGSLALGASLGVLGFDLFRFRRAVTLRNLREHRPPGLDERRLVATGRASYANFGRMVAEFMRLPGIDRSFIDRHVETRGLRHLDAALAGGRGAVLVTGHFGSWELMGCTLVRLGYPVDFVVGIQRNPLVQAQMNRLRTDAGIRVIDLRSTLAILKALRANRFAAMLCDQDAGRAGVFVDFLGGPASTVQGPARLAMAAGTVVIPGFIVRRRALEQCIVIEPPIRPEPGDRSAAVEEITRSYSRVIESYVARYPDHWLWAHRRWKTEPPAGSRRSPDQGGGTRPPKGWNGRPD